MGTMAEHEMHGTTFLQQELQGTLGEGWADAPVTARTYASQRSLRATAGAPTIRVLRTHRIPD